MVPASIGAPTVFVAHVFCGARREGDIQCTLERRSMVGACELAVLSVDICLNATASDLAVEAHVVELGSHVLSGYIRIVIGGPPCEAWSPA